MASSPAQAPGGGELALVRRHHQLGHRLADRLGAGIAEGALGGGVELDDPAAVVGGDVAVERRLQRREPQPLGLLARRLGQLAVGDLAPDALDLDELALGVEDAGVGPVLPVQLAVRGAGRAIPRVLVGFSGVIRAMCACVDRQVLRQDQVGVAHAPARASPPASGRRSAPPPRS